MDRFVIIDLETTGNSFENNDKIIEVGIVVLEDGHITEEFSTFVNPEKPIPPFIMNLTGITDEYVQHAPRFEEIAEDIVALFDNSYLVAHNVPFDLGFLNYELQSIGFSKLLNPVLDTVELARILFPNAPSYKLGQLAEFFHIEHDDPHRALSDAYVTAELLLKLKEKIQMLPTETISHLIKLGKRLKSDLNDVLYQFQDSNRFKQLANMTSFGGLAFRTPQEMHSTKTTMPESFGTYIDCIYEDNGSMEKVFQHYEKREGQRVMSETIYDGFQEHQHVLVEAETGTGKSLAYLIPAAYEAIKTNSRIVISTYTTQLQAQLLDVEIPMLKKVIPFPITAGIIKGKQHYLSLEKFAKALHSNEQDNYDITLTKAILLVWLTETDTGDSDEVNLTSSGYLFFRKISAATEVNVNPSSPWYPFSFYHRAQALANSADLVITNHALLCTDIMKDNKILPDYNKLIIDEAHHFEETVSKHFGLKLDYVSIQHVLNHLGIIGEGRWMDTLRKSYGIENRNFFSNWNDLLTDTKHELDDFFRTLFQFVLNKNKNQPSYNDTGRMQYRFGHSNEKQGQIVHAMAERIVYYLKQISQFLNDIDQDTLSVTMKDELETIVQLLNNFVQSIHHLFLNKDTADNVRWAEIEAFGAKNAVYLYSQPTNVATLLEDKLFNKKDSVVLTSATITMKDSFSYIINQLGIPKERLISKQVQSPFQWKNQVQLMIPNDFPDISQVDDFVYATCEAIISLSKITNGRMLVLFTSYDMLKESYRILKDTMDLSQYMLIAQGISSGSRERLKKNFQTFDKAILLGTSSFWEGIDIPGDDLSCVMIVRLPFEPPNHPVFEAKAQFVKNENKNPFYDLSLPNAVIRFKQGFGRLIRSKSDRGIVFVCDSRIKKARYGSFFIQSIPEVAVHYKSMKELMDIADDWF